MDDVNITVVSGSQVAEQQPAVGVQKPDLPGEGAGPVVVGSGEGSSGRTRLGAVGKKRRGRPRKYDAHGISYGIGESPSKRFPSIGNQHLLGGLAAGTARGSFTPHVVVVQKYEDIVGTISSFSKKGPLSVCVLSATGVVCSVIIRSPDASAGTLRYEGQFEILSLSGSYAFCETDGVQRKNGMLNVSLAKPDGQVFGGGVGGPLIAAGPIQLVLGSFKQTLSNKGKRKLSTKKTDGGDSCNTPISAPLEPVNAEPISAVNPASSLHSAGQSAPELLPLMPDRLTSPDMNARVP